jgi:hypothetical protein
MKSATPVSDAECRTMFRLSAQALTDEEIATRLDREPPTVARHAQGNCHHVQPLQPAAALTEATLTAHLTDLADELQEIPTQALWDRWPGRICSASTVCTKMGEWNAALTAAGFPAVPPNAPAPVRTHLYQQTRTDHADESAQRERLQSPQPVVERDQLPSREQIRTTVCEEWDGRVLSRTGRGHQNVLHVAAGGDPLCQRMTHDDTWREKSLAVYPPGHRDWCHYCLARLFPDRAPGTSTE